MTWRERISVTTNLCHGKPCIRGTRVLVSVVLSEVAAGEPFESIMSGYQIEREDIQAALFLRPTWLRIVMSHFLRRAEMLFKIDENLHGEVAELLRNNGHDAVTVYDQRMRGHPDEELASVCQREVRVLVTQDLDFSNIVAYPPENYPGIIVFRLHDSGRASVLAAIRRLLPLLASQSLLGCLWTVDDVGMRIRPGGQP